MKYRGLGIVLLTCGIGAGVFWALLPAAPVEERLATPAAADSFASGRFRPLVELPKLDPERVALGQALFLERRLSHDNSIACASCHDLERGGGDGRQVAVGIKGQRGELNSPTVFNAALNFAQFWDGRAATLEEQARGPVHNPIEMGSNWAEVIAKLESVDSYRKAFAHAFPDGMTGDNIAAAIAEFERSLITPGSRFDQWLLGREDALSADEKAGFRLFRDFGCGSCHQGVNLGGNMYQKFGIFSPFRPVGRELRSSDLGRFNVTGEASDKGVFKVPSLRNVALTAPYFHDGSASTLDQAVAVMAKVQLGRDIKPREQALIVAFLHTLTGKYKGKPL